MRGPARSWLRRLFRRIGRGPMTKLTVKVIVAMLGIGSIAALVSGAPAHSDQMQLRSGWVCNAYGHGGEKHASRPVTGEREATRLRHQD